VARFRVTRQAETDLDEVWLFISQDSPASADRFLERLHDRFLLLAEHPGIGRRRRSRGKGVRGAALGGYVILYRPMEGGIEVVRVVSGRRDLDILDDV
jgi:toxin ParE1/3/4